MEWTRKLRSSIVKEGRKARRTSWNEGEYLEFKTIDSKNVIHFVTNSTSIPWKGIDRVESRSANDWEYIN